MKNVLRKIVDVLEHIVYIAPDFLTFIPQEGLGCTIEKGHLLKSCQCGKWSIIEVNASVTREKILDLLKEFARERTKYERNMHFI